MVIAVVARPEGRLPETVARDFAATHDLITAASA